MKDIKQEDIEYIVKNTTAMFFGSGKKLTKEQQEIADKIDTAVSEALYEYKAAIETNLSIYFEIIKENPKVTTSLAYNPEVLKKVFKS